MFEGIPIELALGGQGLLILAAVFPYLQIGRGKLVPVSFLEAERQNSERWRRAHEVSEAARGVQSEQLRVLIANDETSLAMLKAVTVRKP